MSVLTISDIKRLQSEGGLIIFDVREPLEFAMGFIPESIYANLQSGIDMSIFQTIIPHDGQVVIVCDREMEIQPVFQIFKDAGFINIAGVHFAGKGSWFQANEPIDMIITIDPDELAMDMPFDENLILIDSRKANEYAEGHIVGARHFPIEDLSDPANIALIPEDGNIYLYCNDGDRSLFTASVFKYQGIHNLRVLTASWIDISKTPGLRVEKDAKQLN